MPRIQPYPAYKPSGIPWLGNVPAHWRLLAGRACYTSKQALNKGMIENTVLSLSYGQVKIRPEEKLHGLVPESFETYQIVEPDDIVCRPTDLQNDWNSLRFGLSRHRGIITAAYICLRTAPELTKRYGYLLLHAYDLKKVFYGLGSGLRQNLGWTDFKALPCLVPPLSEQAAIVRYLDHADRRIRRYINAKRKLIALLEEEKQAIINQAVTRGLDPTVPLKPSGVEWLGDVPVHWAIRPLKRWVSTKITDGPHETPALLADGIPFMSAESMVGGRLDFRRRRGFISRQQHEVYCRKCRPQRDDIFMCKSGATTGKVAIVETTDEFSVWSPLALIRVDPQKVLARLLFTVLQAQYVQRQVQDSWSYGTQPNLAMGAMERLVVVLPPIDEQREMFAHLGQATKRLSEVVDRARRQVELLHEYRIRLIADVVTGKLDVREVAAQLPDEADDQDPLYESGPLADGMDEDLHAPGELAEELAMPSNIP